MKTTISIVMILVGSADAFSAAASFKSSVSSSALNAASIQRQPIMAGNWKMNPSTEEEALTLAKAVANCLGEETCAVGDMDDCTEVVIFPPFPFISKVKDMVSDAGLTVGAQNFFFEDSGAFTGSVSASMVKSIGCEYILCGHSERRTLFADSDVNINLKVKKVLDSGMKPILCIGETKEEFDLNIKKEICAMQLSKDLFGITKEQMKDVVIAYEPVWYVHLNCLLMLRI